MAWLNQTFKFKVLPTLSVFAHSQVGTAAQRYIKELIEKHGRKYSYGAKMTASLVAVASFVSVWRGVSPDSSVVAELKSLHLQCCQHARTTHAQCETRGDAMRRSLDQARMSSHKCAHVIGSWLVLGWLRRVALRKDNCTSTNKIVIDIENGVPKRRPCTAWPESRTSQTRCLNGMKGEG
eukprot:719019-Prymnesium_polylepis.1